MHNTIFLDIGGVFLTNGWDHAARERTTSHFGIAPEDFETRHRAAVDDFETGRLSLDAYLDRTVFHQPRAFARDAVTQFMFEQSQPYPEALAELAKLAQSRRFLLATLNNESRELNRYRIERYGLRDYFTVFLSSCYLGVRKPDERMYRLALEIMQRTGDECVFVDDRAANVRAARAAGLHSIQYTGPGDLRSLLQ